MAGNGSNFTTVAGTEYNVRNVAISANGIAYPISMIDRVNRPITVLTNLTTDDLNRRDPKLGVVYFKSNTKVLGWAKSISQKVAPNGTR